MRPLVLIALFALAATPALAEPVQTAGPSPAAQQQAIVQKLMEEVQSNINLRVQLIQAQSELKALQEQTKQVEPSKPSEKPTPLPAGK